jgi:predicted transcriptional regulator
VTKRDHGRRPSGALEAEVLAALWAANEPLTPAGVQRELDGALAYTTVMTALTRLHDKGVVTRCRAGRAYAYAPRLDQAGIAAARMRELLDAGADRRAVLAQFVGALDPRDERLLEELLRASRDDGAQT